MEPGSCTSHYERHFDHQSEVTLLYDANTRVSTEEPATTSEFALSDGNGCPVCGTSKKSGKRSCCARGGAWFKNCGDVGDTKLDHTWAEGVQACESTLYRLFVSVMHHVCEPDCLEGYLPSHPQEACVGTTCSLSHITPVLHRSTRDDGFVCGKSFKRMPKVRYYQEIR